jgi:hypothetical protein
MKNKLYLTEQEKNSILEQHNFYKNAILNAKNLLKEQELTGEELIKKAIELNCRIIAGARPFNSPTRGRFYRKTADYDEPRGPFKKGDLLDFAIPDSQNPATWTFTITPIVNNQPERTADGKIVRNGPKKWGCKALTQFLGRFQTYDVTEWKQSGNWKTRDEAMKDKSIDFTVKTSYEEQQGPDGKLYYRNRTDAPTGVTGVRAKNEILTYWRNKFDEALEYKGGNDDPKFKTWGFQQPYQMGWKEYVIPDKEKQFAENIRIFLSPKKYKEVTTSSSTEVGKTAGELKVSERDCRKNAETYYEAYLSGNEFSANEELLKKNLIACHRRYCRPRENQGKCGKLGGLFGSQLDELLDFFKGMGDYKGQRIGRQERWHLEQK